MDAHVGTVFEGVPIICGNYSYGQGDTQCHSLNTKNMAWEKVRSIIIKNCSVESRETLNEKHWKGLGYIELSV